MTADEKEFAAMQKVADALEGLPHNACVRVIQWAASRADGRRQQAQEELMWRRQGQGMVVGMVEQGKPFENDS